MTKDQLKNELNKFDTLEQMIKYLLNTFDLSKPLGAITKPLIVSGLLKAFDMVKPSKK